MRLFLVRKRDNILIPVLEKNNTVIATPILVEKMMDVSN